ncbi:uncharacterized protein [Ptychodera flava]|uniref:uncharacterized protein n=1 Tax=Ptychodera flava TaxID=63121 RepID=UPI003969ECE3
MANCGRNTLPVARMNKEQLQVHLRNKHFPQAVLKILYDQQIDGTDFIDLEWNDINNLMSGFPFREKKAILLFIEKVKKSDTPPIADSTHLLNGDSHQTHQGPALLAIKQECSDCYIITSPGEAHTPTASTTHYQRALCESMNSNVPVTPQESPAYHATTATQEFSTPLSPCNTAQGMLLNETNANPQLDTSPATQNSRFGQRKRNRSRPTMWKDDFEFFHNPKLPDHLDALLKKKTTRDLPWKALLQACRSIQSYIEMKLGRKPLKPERDAIARDFIRVYPCLASLDETGPKESVLTEQIRVRWKNNEHTVKKKFERLENMKGDRRNATESKTKRRKIESVGRSPTQYAASGIVENQETSLPNCNTDVERLSLEQPVVNSIQTHHSEMLCDSNSSYSYLEPSHTVYATQEHAGNNRASQPSCSQSVYETVSSSKGHQMNCRHLACQVSPRNLQLYLDQKPSDGMPVDPSESNNSKSPYASVKPLDNQAGPGHQPSANNGLFHQTFHGQPVNQTASTSWNHQKEMKTKEIFQSQPHDLQKNQCEAIFPRSA